MFNYYGHSKEDFKEIQSLIRATDQYNMHLMSLTLFIILLILSFISSVIPFASQFKQIYLLFTIIFFIFNIAIQKFNKYHRFCIYCLIILLFSLSIILTLFIPDQPATIFPVVLMTVPLLFTATFYSLSILSILSSFIYIALVHFYKNPDIAAFDTYNILVLLIISFILRFLIQKQNVAGMRFKIENQHLLDKLNYDVKHDPLTNLLNRKAFVNTIVDEHQAFIKSDYGVLGIIDIDCFKTINDTYGHRQGDEVIVEVSSILKRCFYETDIIGRLGGDEFIFCLTKRSNTENIINEINYVIKEINNITVNDHEKIGVSIGIVHLSQTKLSFKEAYKKADITLYKAKSTGKNKVSECY